MAWVHECIYAGGGEYLPKNWGSFRDQTGISAILHLRPEKPAIFCGPPAQAFLWLDIADEIQAGLHERRQAGRFVCENLAEGRRILIHSSLGQHRTRWVYVAYMICSGSRLSTALRLAIEPPWLAPYETDVCLWEAFVEFIREQAS